MKKEILIESRLEDLLLAFRRKIFDALRKEAIRFELTIPQIEIMRFIAETSNPVSMKMIADHLKITPPSATIFVGELEQKGLIKRIPDLSDRRVVCIVLTAKAKKRQQSIMDRKKTIFHEMTSRLTPQDRKNLERIITILINY